MTLILRIHADEAKFSEAKIYHARSLYAEGEHPTLTKKLFTDERRDSILRFLVEKTHQFALFNDEGDAAAIDEPVKDFQLVLFLKLSEDE